MSSPLTRTYALPAGPRVHLRLARRSDHDAVAALLAARGVDASRDDVLRLLSYDPVRRVVLCALAPVDGAERVVGIAAVDLIPGAGPDTVVVDEGLTDGLGELLGAVLAERAEAAATPRQAARALDTRRSRFGSTGTSTRLTYSAPPCSATSRSGSQRRP